MPIPEGLDLDEWINEPPAEDEPEEYSAKGFDFLKEQEEERVEERKFDPVEEQKVTIYNRNYNCIHLFYFCKIY